MNIKRLFFLILSFFIISCQKKIIEENDYLKTSQSNIFTIDYTKIIKKNEKEKSLSLGTLEKINTLNPYRANSKIEFFLKNALYSTFFYINPQDGSIKNNLVDSYSIGNNGTEIKLKLKEIIKSDDVIASLSLLNSHLKNSYYYKQFFIKNSKLQLEKIDDFNFKIILDVPNSNILYALATYPILSKSDIDNIKDFEYFIIKWLPSTSTGPYKIKYFDEKNLILIKNESYFKKDKPETEEIYIKFYSSINDMVMAFINGEIDIIEFTEYEDFNNLYHYASSNKIQSIKFIETNESIKKCFLLWNKESYKDINSFIYFNLKEKYNISSNLNMEKKNFRERNTISTNKKLRILSYEENCLEKKIIEDIYSLLKNNFLDLTCDYSPFYKYLEKIFFKENQFDFTILSYNFKPDIYSYYSFFLDENYGLNRFFEEEEIIKSFDYILKEYDNTKHKKEISKIFDLLERKNKLNLFFSFKKYYAINSKIYNFKINSTYEDNFNLVTLENIFKTK
ncbi:MAG TPA: ABC transporter substrate-binding protein [Spirochaetota bacterium]|nr:ABC transporter substrate-binding protein [Spirochaetota bacterium]HOL57334.1 ABC transporter substrate-binding protein [Spirochaetota bacterium]HPP04881.1 ABC transporter substrate-binding protein [Spirochaetota bacterium]